MSLSLFEIPDGVSQITKTLKNAGFEAFLVGGCVRDLILGKKPKDWDVTTNATPEQIISLFPKTFYENSFGTVGVVTEMAEDPSLEIVEVTPYRLETVYSDFRHPDKVSFSQNLEDDLKRRDFTINALALDEGSDGKASRIVDLYNGQKDIRDHIIRCVGDGNERFSEDALRMLRAVRFLAELGFTINKETADALMLNVKLIQNIAFERIRDEFSKIIMSDEPMIGIIMAQKLGILRYIVPELEESIGVEQNQAHAFAVWEHLLRSLQHASDKKWPLEIRLAALFHDIGKPKSRRKSPETGEWTFYGHEVIGEKMTRKILERLKYPKKVVDQVTTLVRWHMFFSDTEKITHTAVRRMIRNVGQENIWNLMNLRICDRIGTGRPKENPYRFRKYKAMIDEVMRDPVSVGMLKIDGKRIMEVAKINPGPKVGYILNALLEEVLEKPALNTSEYLENMAKKLAILDDTELKKLSEKGKEKKEEIEEIELKKIHQKHHIE
ncbi:MAG: CCA tRNA nucleotidyltransferase [Candidatus Pacebacteria bacterium]|nr:CCA tRNA nucleotidyltransferase [Candidatus Paceibacterota bacterium]